MSAIFLKVVNMSIASGWLVLAVLLLRLVLKKAPKWVSVLLWGLVAVRLLCPISFESIFSLIPSRETVSPDIMMDWTPEISTGIGSIDTVVNPIITESFAPDLGASMNPLQLWIPLAALIWLVGIAVMLLYTAVSYLLLRHRVATAVRLRDNIYQSENVASPFVLGVCKPKIYLPFRMDSQSLTYVIAHEQAHIRRKDHWWKPVGFLLLAIHWFNPLVWLGYLLLCRDIELACDEKVIKEMDKENRADYTQALVACSVNRRSIAACPLAFGEVGVKARVKSVLNYKKPAFWMILVAIIACVAVAVCFLTDPVGDSGTAVNNAGIVKTFTTNLKTYYQLSDGTWRVDGRDYKYRLEITGRMHDAAVDSTFVYLSNRETITFDQAWKAAGFSSNTEDYFPVEEAVLVELEPDGYARGSIIIGKNTFIVDENSLEKALTTAILEQNAADRFPESPPGMIHTEAHQVLGIQSSPALEGEKEYIKELTVYVQYVYHRYSPFGSEMSSVGSIATPAVIRFRGGPARGYELLEFQEPKGGNIYAEEISRLFPQEIADVLLNPQNQVVDMENLETVCREKAKRILQTK